MNAKFMFFLRPQAQGRADGAERRGGAQRRRGFTLVEVIVVLVILAILAAIAIPALTGYIDKAQDKQYIMQARERMIALDAVLNEAYATGEISAKTAAEKLFTTGGRLGTSNIQMFVPGQIANVSTGSWGTYVIRQNALIAKTSPASVNDPGYYEDYILALYPSDATAASADGYWVEYYPEGQPKSDPTKNAPEVIVTYKVDHLSNVTTHAEFNAAIRASGHYNENAGYEVYHVTYR
jgi:prepilin-type N-terminal cleavage/methylation domain-containing protein